MPPPALAGVPVSFFLLQEKSPQKEEDREVRQGLTMGLSTLYATLHCDAVAQDSTQTEPRHRLLPEGRCGPEQGQETRKWGSVMAQEQEAHRRNTEQHRQEGGHEAGTTRHTVVEVTRGQTVQDHHPQFLNALYNPPLSIQGVSTCVTETVCGRTAW